MKVIITGTFAALALSAAIASSQTPPAQTPSGQTPPSTAQPSGQTKPTEQTPPSSAQTADQKPAQAGKTTTYRGYLRGSDASGWTFSPVADRAASAAPGATATAGATKPSAATYSVVVPAGTKADLATMGDQCVEIVGVLAPEHAAKAGEAGNTAAGASSTTRSTTGNTAGGSMSAHNRELTVTTIRAAQGCTPQ